MKNKPVTIGALVIIGWVLAMALAVVLRMRMIVSIAPILLVGYVAYLIWVAVNREETKEKKGREESFDE